MKSDKPTIVKPHPLDNYLIMALDKDWLKIFDVSPIFEAFIDHEKKLVLKSITPVNDETTRGAEK